MKAPSSSGLLWTALIALGVTALYHKGMIPGLKDQKKVETT